MRAQPAELGILTGEDGAEYGPVGGRADTYLEGRPRCAEGVDEMLKVARESDTVHASVARELLQTVLDKERAVLQAEDEEVALARIAMVAQKEDSPSFFIDHALVGVIHDPLPRREGPAQAAIGIMHSKVAEARALTRPHKPTIP